MWNCANLAFLELFGTSPCPRPTREVPRLALLAFSCTLANRSGESGCSEGVCSPAGGAGLCLGQAMMLAPDGLFQCCHISYRRVLALYPMTWQEYALQAQDIARPDRAL